MKFGTLAAGIMAAAVVFNGAHANAATLYTYSGNNFSVFGGTSFDMTMSVSGSFTMANPLPPNQSGAIFFTPLSFSFSNGLATVTNQNAGLAIFQVETDGSGNILGWNIQVAAGDTDIPGGQIDGIESLFVADVGTLTLCTARSSIGTCISEVTEFGLTASLGTWSSALVTTPLPTTLPLFATGLGALGLLGWRRKRKALAA
jgi:hypothetical protein